jgi:hypothetical protein
MAKGYIFVVVKCKRNIILLVTHSARLAMHHLTEGRRVDIWRTNRLVRKLYSGERFKLMTYVKEEIDTLHNDSQVEEKTQ